MPTCFKYFFFALIAFHLSNDLAAQACPPNLDFERGDFTYWTCRTGSVSIVNGENTIMWTGSGQVNGRQTIISAATAGTDFYGGFSRVSPNGSGYSVQLGNAGQDAQAEDLSYIFTVPANANSFSIIFQYAIVLENPNHTIEQQPRFRALIHNLTDGGVLSCVSFDFSATSGIPGFKGSPKKNDVIYKDWTPVTVNLTNLAGKVLDLEFITSDCTEGGHFGYAYVDVNSSCNGTIQGSTICGNDRSVSLTAPYGFQSYEWYSGNNFSVSLGNEQVLTITPPPPVGAIFPVIVTPYPGFGCIDTLYATISQAPKPISYAGPDISLCKPQPAFIGGPPTPGYFYIWTPTRQVSNPSISNPRVLSASLAGQEFIVKTTDLQTGCYSYDTTIVTAKVDTAIGVNGKTDFCFGETIIPPSLSVTNLSVGVQWHNASGPIPGAISPNFQTPGIGSYWAEILENGCVDTTRIVDVALHPLPLVSFTSSATTECITDNSFTFNNSSTSPDHALMTYFWEFSNGNGYVGGSAVQTFASAQTYNIELVVTTSFGCADSIAHTVVVLPNAVPDFSWDYICINSPVLYKNLTNEKGATQASYVWDFKDGGPGSTLKDPLPVIYTRVDTLDVMLQVTVAGCETHPQSIVKKVEISTPTAGIRYPDVTIALGFPKYINARNNGGNSYHWQPETGLTSYFTRYTQFTANHDVEYTIDVSDQHGCFSTDTLQVFILTKPGFYLPTVFSPNNDGLNDVVRPYLVGTKTLKDFSIYNRSGNLIFHSSKYGEGWDGKFKGIEQDGGVYVWILSFINDDGKTLTEKGTITLVR